MRRIFGGANLPISSTSSSLASDSLSSPGPPRSATSPSPSDPYSSSTEPSEPTRKGWFGAVSETFGAGIAGASRQGHHARSSTLTSDGSGPSGASTTLASSFGNLPAAGGEEDEEEYGKLPFGAARLQSPPPSRAGDHGRSPGSRNHTRNGSRNGSDAHGGRVSALSGRGYAEGERPSTPAEEKDALMVELLSGQAIVEAKDFDILDWDDMQAIKKVRLVSKEIRCLGGELIFWIPLRAGTRRPREPNRLPHPLRRPRNKAPRLSRQARPPLRPRLRRLLHFLPPTRDP